MARRRQRPLFRSPLYPISDTWVTGPGVTCSILRFRLMASWSLNEVPERGPVLLPGLLVPELPYSVFPHFLQRAAGLQSLSDVPETWRSRPIPPWRGIPCQIGSVFMRCLNQDAADNPFLFRLLVLLPERDPPGPRPEHVLLGTEFLLHYGLQEVLDYSSIQYLEDPSGGQRSIDPSILCGFLEKL